MKLEERIVALESEMRNLIRQHHSLLILMEDREERVRENRIKIKIPHRCPVCLGLMVLESNEVCPPCEGSGIVWG